MKKIKLDDLYFGVTLYPLSYSSRSERRLTSYNLFSFARVKWAVASYASKTSEEKKKITDPLMYCFSSVWSRTEFEFIVCPWGGLDDEDKVVDVGTKVDVYHMFVIPNANLLMDMVNSVSVSSAKSYLREERKRDRR